MSNSRHGPPKRPSRDKSSREGSGVRSGRSSRPGRSSPPGRGSRSRGRQSSESSLPWRKIALMVGGGLVILLAIFFGVQALTGDEEAAPAESLVQPTASPVPIATATAITTTISASPTVSNTQEVEPIVVEPTVVEPTVAAETSQAADIPSLQQYMLSLVNEDRQANGLTEVAWDEVAAIASQLHAEEMASFGYLSHWNLNGHGPDYRYSLGGGLDYARENVHATDVGGAAKPNSAEAFRELIRKAQGGLMNSPGHRANILAPEHTHLGIGIAYDADQGRLRISQSFVDRYVALEPLPHHLPLRGEITLSGRLREGASNPLLNLAYQPLPSKMSISQLEATSTYDASGEIYDDLRLEVDGEGRFWQSIILNHQDQPGLYHVRVWVETGLGQVLASKVIIEVQ